MAFIRSKRSGATGTVYQVVHGWREDGKVRSKVLASLGTYDSISEAIRDARRQRTRARHEAWRGERYTGLAER